MTDPDRAALLKAIHDAHSQELLRYVLRLTRGDMQFAEDVVQESLLRLWRKPELLQQLHRRGEGLVVHRRPQPGHRRPPKRKVRT